MRIAKRPWVPAVCLTATSLTAGLLWGMACYFPAVLVSMSALVSLAWTLRCQGEVDRKIDLILGALSNDDGSVRFPTYQGDKDERSVNLRLNRIMEILNESRAEIRQSEQYYSAILDMADTAIFVCDNLGLVREANKASLTLFGIEVITHLNQIEAKAPGIRNLIISSAPGDRFEFEISRDGTNCMVSIAVSSLDTATCHCKIVAVNDIHRELDHREIEAWTRLIRVMTHEVMNCLSPVISLSQTLRTLPPSEIGEIYKGLEDIGHTGQGLLDFVQSYRRLTRIPSPSPILVNVRTMLKRIISLGQQYAMGLVGFVLAECDDSLMIYADKAMVTQILVNLVKNAVEAIVNVEDAIGGDMQDYEISATGNDIMGTISLKAFVRPDEAVCIEVSNTGPRIPFEDHDQIFVPFFTTKSSGSGIGLSLSRQMMAMMGGSLILKPYLTPQTPTTFLLLFR